MNRDRPDWRILLALAALSLAGCADELAEPRPVAAPADSQRVADATEFSASEAEPPEAGPGSPPATIRPASVEVGERAPDFDATGLDGETVSLSDFLGEQRVVLAFSRAHW